jgi:hypothetical protein
MPDGDRRNAPLQLRPLMRDAKGAGARCWRCVARRRAGSGLYVWPDVLPVARTMVSSDITMPSFNGVCGLI